jgi:hypothetical protein
VGTILGTICIFVDMSYSITLDFRTGTKKPVKELRLRIRSVTAKVDVRKVTGIKVEEKHFNFTKQTLSIESEHYKWFNQVKKLIPDEIRALHNAEYSVETSLRNLLNLEKIESAGDKLWENYVSKTSNSESTIENRLSNVNWVENNTPYKPLTKLHLSDAAIVKEIAVAIKTSKDHTLSGADNKLKKLDDLANTAFGSGKNLFRPFQQNGHYIAGASSGSSDIKFTDAYDFKNGIKNIKTGQDLEATLTFLLSYCLCIDGQDLSRIDKSTINHYAPYPEGEKDVDFANNAIKHQNDFHLKEAYYFDRKLIMNRGKQQLRESTVKFNIYPIPRIFQLLKRVIAEHRPARAYQGNDPFRLYNFKTDNFEGKKKWKQITNVVTDKLKRMSGTYLSSQRGTFNSYLSDLAVPQVVCKAFLKHSFKQSTFEKHYLKHPQQKFFIVQQAGIDAFDAIGTWYLILAKATELNLIPKEFKIAEFDKEMIKKGKLLDKSWNEEWQEYKNVEKTLQKSFSKEETNKAKDILGF